jgi:hypothetical protein
MTELHDRLAALSPAKRALLEKLRVAQAPRPIPRIADGPAPLSAEQRRLWYLAQLAPGTRSTPSPWACACTGRWTWTRCWARCATWWPGTSRCAPPSARARGSRCRRCATGRLRAGGAGPARRRVGRRRGQLPDRRLRPPHLRPAPRRDLPRAAGARGRRRAPPAAGAAPPGGRRLVGGRAAARPGRAVRRPSAGAGSRGSPSCRCATATGRRGSSAPTARAGRGRGVLARAGGGRAAGAGAPPGPPAPPVQGWDGAKHPWELAPPLAGRCARWPAARRHAVRGAGGGVRAAAEALHGRDDLLLGTLLANRPRPELEHLVGFFANTLPLRLRMDGDPTAAEMVRRAHAAARGRAGARVAPLRPHRGDRRRAARLQPPAAGAGGAHLGRFARLRAGAPRRHRRAAAPGLEHRRLRADAAVEDRGDRFACILPVRHRAVRRAAPSRGWRGSWRPCSPPSRPMPGSALRGPLAREDEVRVVEARSAAALRGRRPAPCTSWSSGRRAPRRTRRRSSTAARR